MDNQHRQIKGYRDLNQIDLDLVNKIKQQGAALEALIEEVNQHITRQFGDTLPPGYDHGGIMIEDYRTEEQKIEYERLIRSEPHLWRLHARRKLQEGLMFLTRAVTQPEGF